MFAPVYFSPVYFAPVYWPPGGETGYDTHDGFGYYPEIRREPIETPAQQYAHDQAVLREIINEAADPRALINEVTPVKTLVASPTDRNARADTLNLYYAGVLVDLLSLEFELRVAEMVKEEEATEILLLERLL